MLGLKLNHVSKRGHKAVAYERLVEAFFCVVQFELNLQNLFHQLKIDSIMSDELDTFYQRLDQFKILKILMAIFLVD